MHVAFVVSGVTTGVMTVGDALLGWPLLVLPMAAVAAAVLAVSLTASAIETSFLFLGVPLLTRSLPALMHGLPGGFPMGLVRAIDNMTLFFPDTADVTPWPYATFARGGSAAPSSLGMSFLHLALACAFWVVLGLYRQRRHDFGSRTAVK